MTTVWNIDSVHTHVQFSARHLMVSNVKGRIAKVSGTVRLEESDGQSDFTRSQIDVNMDVSSLDTQEPQRDQHLRSADFLEVEKYPTITFRSTRIVPRGTAGEYDLTGDLTIHGTTLPITLAVDAPTPAVRDPWGGTRRGFEASGKLSRKQFGLTWNQALEAGGVMVGDEIKIGLEVELVLAADKAA
ncbi:MAG: YceI family protein [Terriglobales bacterium]